MKNPDRRGVLRIAALAALALPPLALPLEARAEDWPSRPIRLVVPFSAGTTTDILARLLATSLSRSLGQTVVVDNRSGAGGNIGAGLVANAPADGYTLLFGTNGTNGVNASLYKTLGYDPVADFAAIAPIATTTAVLAVRAGLPARDLAGLIELAKKQSLTFASAGNGTTGHLSQALLNQRAGIETVHVPYRNGAQAIGDMLSGTVDAMFYHYLALAPHFREGTLRAIAVTSARRASMLPDVPTVTEGGLADFVVDGWWGLYAPAGTAASSVRRLADAANAFLADSDAQANLQRQGMEPIGGSPDRLAEMTRTEVAKWREVIARAGIQVD
ncbi:tripartite-type tricarboxylate transporter receptor subunit TctC [Humitalea rosea]|uniref:Tripartite-type tricarboxylate transporter receptor subunit TctC n=1 Tax=Humitalea rosea TaxID=990373 RepID=A0A2W7JGB2_9PROT|nr:tripartite tricarboxylate transporter substrate binding protein [Humitalea rosea]PZW51113.1 tripartite-type tricarboxylate transporter receptor subunit TctC [Humitalea rosea]